MEAAEAPLFFIQFQFEEAVMAKPTTVKIKLVSSADTGFYYVTKKNPRNTTEKMTFRKYDPVVRKHVEFKEAKIKYGARGPRPRKSERKGVAATAGGALCACLEPAASEGGQVGAFSAKGESWSASALRKAGRDSQRCCRASSRGRAATRSVWRRMRRTVVIIRSPIVNRSLSR